MIQLTADLSKAYHFTSTATRIAVIRKLQDAHGLQGVALYSYVTVQFCGRRMFVSAIGGV